MDYYRKKQLIAAVDRHDTVTGAVDKWQAHKKGLLHRGFTVALICREGIILQHRKHPVFDGYFDLTCSSHPVYHQGKLQGMTDAVYDSLAREWNINENKRPIALTHKGSVAYKAKDEASGFIEHEICHLYTAEITSLLLPQFDYAYGFSLLPKDTLRSCRLRFAPWVKKLIGLL